MIKLHKRPKIFESVERLISRLPGLGHRSARRILLSFLEKPDTFLLPLKEVLEHLIEETQTCTLCGLFDVQTPCGICRDVERNTSILCVVSNVADAWALERSSLHRGKYHILGGNLQAYRDRGKHALNVGSLLKRLDKIQEIIIATSFTVEGQTTAHYIAQLIREYDPKMKLSRLAQGLPTGAELDYLDEGTLALAVNQRTPFSSY